MDRRSSYTAIFFLDFIFVNFFHENPFYIFTQLRLFDKIVFARKSVNAYKKVGKPIAIIDQMVYDKSMKQTQSCLFENL